MVVCHDAGGAEVVSAWVRRHLKEWSPTFLLAGPALEIFSRKIDVKSYDTWQPDFVLCGSGSEWERTGVEIARNQGIPCAAYLDHWVNYRERFDDLPDEIWVADEYAYDLALAAFPACKVVLRGNPYLEDLTSEIAAYEATRIRLLGEKHALYVCDRGELNPPSNLTVQDWTHFRVRPHPADAGRYPRTLALDISWADTVIGGDSMALVVALQAGRRVISTVPASEASIPYPGIERP